MKKKTVLLGLILVFLCVGGIIWYKNINKTNIPSYNSKFNTKIPVDLKRMYVKSNIEFVDGIIYEVYQKNNNEFFKSFDKTNNNQCLEFITKNKEFNELKVEIKNLPDLKLDFESKLIKDQKDKSSLYLIIQNNNLYVIGDYY